MATVTITIPDSHMTGLAQAAGATLLDRPSGTPSEVVATAVRGWLSSLYVQHAQRTAAASDPAAVAARVAEDEAQQARRDALAARDAAQAEARDAALSDAALWS